MRVLLWVQFVLLTCVLVFSVASNPSAHPTSDLAGVGALIAVCSMASQFALLRLTLPGAPQTAAMTGNVTDAVLSVLDTLFHQRSVTGDSKDRLRRSGQVLGGFFGGCVIGGVAVHLVSDWAWMLPTGLAALALTLHEEHPRRNGAI